MSLKKKGVNYNYPQKMNFIDSMLHNRENNYHVGLQTIS